MKKFLSILAVLILSGIIFAQDIIIKDNDKPENSLLQINDEGNYGSISLTPWTDDPPGDPQTNILHNRDGALYWEGNPLGIADASGWSDTGSNVYLGTSSDNVMIGGSSPTEKLDIVGNMNLSGTADFQNLTIMSNAGTSNTLLGNYTGLSNIGTGNTFLGYLAGNDNTTGYYNTFFGAVTGENNTTGSNNSFLGHHAGRDNISGSHNTYVGYFAAYNGAAAADSNTCIGKWAGYNNDSGSSNTYVGMNIAVNATTGKDNTCIGYHSGIGLHSGSSNVMVGFSSGRGCDLSSNNTYLGFRTSGDVSSDGAQNIFIGHRAGHDEIQSNKLYIENSESPAPLIGGDFSLGGIFINGKLGVGTSAIDEKFEIEFGSDAIDFEIGNNGGATFLAVRNPDGTKYYISVENGGNILVSTIKP